MRQIRSEKGQASNMQQVEHKKSTKIKLIKRRIINRENSILRMSSYKKKSLASKIKNKKGKNLKSKLAAPPKDQHKQLVQEQINQSKIQNSGSVSLAKATKINSDRKRKNPYHIYRQDKKKQYFDKLNSEYNTQIQTRNSEIKKKVSLTKQENKQVKKGQTTNKSCARKVQFEQQIQIREYKQEEIVATFLENVPFQQEVNQEENKLDA